MRWGGEGGKEGGRFCICIDQRKGWRVITWKLLRGCIEIIPSVTGVLTVTLTHVAQTCSYCISSDVQSLNFRMLLLLPSAVLRFLIDGWVLHASGLTGFIWAAACSDHSRHCRPSTVITLRKYTESFHQDRKCSACIKLPLLLSCWHFLLYGLSCCKGSGQVQATCCFCQFLFLFIFSFELVMWSLLNAVGHVGGRGFEGWNRYFN